MAAGSWEDRVRFLDGGTAFVPGVIAVKADTAEAAQRAREVLVGVGVAPGDDDAGSQVAGEVGEPDPIIDGWYRFSVPFAPSAGVIALTAAGFEAQLVHAFFSHRFEGNPFHGSPFHGSPFHGSPFHGSPFHGSPFHGSPFHGSPFHGSAEPNPAAMPLLQDTGERYSSAIPVAPRGRIAPQAAPSRPVHVAILDTGWIRGAEAHLAGMKAPTVIDMANVPGVAEPLSRTDVPDANGDHYLDPVTGHATFIAGIIERRSPGCQITILPVLTEYGDGREDTIAAALVHLLEMRQVPDLVNLSFGGYVFATPDAPALGGVGLLTDAIRRLRQRGVVVVASAGNDASFAPTVPASLPGVVGVAAVDEWGYPAAFSNYGPWVSACALGVDVISIFFSGFPLADQEFFGLHPKQFSGWAAWSGTSFAAPRVLAAIAARMKAENVDADTAASAVIGPPRAVARLPRYGTLVDAQEHTGPGAGF
jgi:subtilisin family serine protease